MQYDPSTSCLHGDVTLPDHSGMATHALVIMLGGVTTRWKQTVGYHFTDNSVNGVSLKPLILEILRWAKSIGLHVTCITSDMGSANLALFKSFGIVCSRFCTTVNRIPHPCEASRHLHFMYDVPHIIKNLWAAVVNGNAITLSENVVNRFRLPTNSVTADHIKSLLSFQAGKDLKLAPKLTNPVVNPSHFAKMRVAGALNFFSHSVSSGLRYLVDCEGYDQAHLTTAWFVELVNK